MVGLDWRNQPCCANNCIGWEPHIAMVTRSRYVSLVHIFTSVMLRKVRPAAVVPQFAINNARTLAPSIPVSLLKCRPEKSLLRLLRAFYHSLPRIRDQPSGVNDCLAGFRKRNDLECFSRCFIQDKIVADVQFVSLVRFDVGDFH